MLYMITFTINIPPILAYIPYMDLMGMVGKLEKHLRALKHQGALKEAHGESYLRTAGLLPGFLFRNQSGKIWKRS